MLLPFACLPQAKSGRMPGIYRRLKGLQNQLSGGRKRDSGAEMINDVVQSRSAVINQIFKMDFHDSGRFKPAHIWIEASRDIGKIGRRVRASKDADLETRIEVRKRLVIVVMDMVRFHFSHIKNMRDDHIARITKDEIRNKCGCIDASKNLRPRKKMRRSNIAWAQRIQPCQSLFGRALASALAFIFSVERMQSAGERGNVIKTEQDLIEQMRTTFWEGNAKQNRPAILRRAERGKTHALNKFFSLI